MNNNIAIGTSGFGLGRKRYVEVFPVVEVQQTFYQPPRFSTLERWRQEVPLDFEFTLKAWQLITHEAKSPTYRRLKKVLTKTETADAGAFKPTAIVREAWEVTRACAAALGARTVLFQSPASFTPTETNIANLSNFFSKTDRADLNLCWEPRGDWDPKTVTRLCGDLDLCHVVDPFVTRTVTPAKGYFRLHGRNGWRYKYEDSELRELATQVRESARAGSAYVFFNNSEMTDDAKRFQTLIEADSPS